MEFERGAMGYQRRQVRDFLDRVAHEAESVLAEVQGLRRQVASQGAQIDELRTAEAQLKRTVIAAERIGNEMKEQAKREADLVLQKARQERLDLLREAASQLDAARAELTRLEHAQALVREQLRGQLTAFLAALDARPTRRSLHVDDGAEDVIAALKATVEAARREAIPGRSGDGQSDASSRRPDEPGPDEGSPEPSDAAPSGPDAAVSAAPDSVDTTGAESDEGDAEEPSAA